jgi:hypothetical protein
MSSILAGERDPPDPPAAETAFGYVRDGQHVNETLDGRCWSLKVLGLRGECIL